MVDCLNHKLNFKICEMGFVANLTDILEGNENVNQRNITVAGRIKNIYGPTFIDDWRIILTLCDIHKERVEFEIKIYLRVS